jgi:hypothetical protein
MRIPPPVRPAVDVASLMRFTAFIMIGRSARKARAEAGRGGNCALCIIVGWLRLLLGASLQFYDTHVM